jgi:hypothetical protein
VLGISSLVPTSTKNPKNEQKFITEVNSTGEGSGLSEDLESVGKLSNLVLGDLILAFNGLVSL